MKTYDEIMALYVEPLMKQLIKVEIALSKEKDLEDSPQKRGLHEFLRDVIEDYQEFRDGSFENADENLIPSVDIDGSEGGNVATEDAEFESGLGDQGINLEDFDKDEDEEMPEDDVPEND